MKPAETPDLPRPQLTVRQLDFHVGEGDEHAVRPDQLLIQDVMQMGSLISGEAIVLFGGRQRHLYPGRIHAHWGAVPHTTVWMARGTRFRAVHLPLPWFLNWNLPPAFVEALLAGTHVEERDTSAERQQLDMLLLEQWRRDSQFGDEEQRRICLDEIRNRFGRLARSYAPTGLVAESAALGARTNHVPATFYQIINYVAVHYMEPIQIKDIAEEVGLHADHVSRVFSKVWGMSLLQYIARHRVLHAQRLLAISAMKTDAIARQSGFGSVRQFFDVFRESTGLTPSAYRKSMEAAEHINVGVKAPSLENSKVPK